MPLSQSDLIILVRQLWHLRDNNIAATNLEDNGVGESIVLPELEHHFETTKLPLKKENNSIIFKHFFNKIVILKSVVYITYLIVINCIHMILFVQ